MPEEGIFGIVEGPADAHGLCLWACMIVLGVSCATAGDAMPLRPRLFEWRRRGHVMLRHQLRPAQIAAICRVSARPHRRPCADLMHVNQTGLVACAGPRLMMSFFDAVLLYQSDSGFSWRPGELEPFWGRNPETTDVHYPPP